MASATLERVESGEITLSLTSAGDCELELRSLEDQRQAFAQVFGQPLVVAPA